MDLDNPVKFYRHVDTLESLLPSAANAYAANDEISYSIIYIVKLAIAII